MTGLVPSRLEPGVADGSEIAPRRSVSECVAVYEQSVAEIKLACAMIADAERRMNETFTLGESGAIYLSVHGRVSFDHIEDNLHQIRMQVWRAIVERTEIRRMLSTKRAKELDALLERNRWNNRDQEGLPEISVEAVQSLVKSFTAQMGDLLDEAIAEVFEKLRPHPAHRQTYKTNSEMEIGKRVILSRPVAMGFGHNFDVNSHWDADLTAIENVFNALDGKGQITRGYYSDLSNAIKATPMIGNGRGETDLFKFRCCGNGNLHLEFRRLDLLAALNRRAGGKRLRPPEAKAS